jgi:hypothetical protein
MKAAVPAHASQGNTTLGHGQDSRNRWRACQTGIGALLCHEDLPDRVHHEEPRAMGVGDSLDSTLACLVLTPVFQSLAESVRIRIAS